MKCATCGEEHDLLEPTFRRPDVVVALPDSERAARVKESDDLCIVKPADDGGGYRFFVRGVLKVPLLDAEGESAWGLWAELSSDDCRTVYDKWTDPDQTQVPPMPALIANRVPGYPDTVGLPALLRLTGPTTRPELTLDAASVHPFALECRQGVCVHRVMEWLAAFRGDDRRPALG